jgi:hypothetical protein
MVTETNEFAFKMWQQAHIKIAASAPADITGKAAQAGCYKNDDEQCLFHVG